MGLDLGDQAPDFTLKGVDGAYHSIDEFEHKAVCIIFTCNHCPYVQAYEDRINQLHKDYEDLQVICINSNDADKYGEDSYENMIERAEDEDFTFHYLRDDDQHVAKEYGATHTPEAFLLGPDRTLQYRGRIDDNWRDADGVSDETLRKAIEAVLADKEVGDPLEPAIGCTIKWK